MTHDEIAKSIWENHRDIKADQIRWNTSGYHMVEGDKKKFK